MKTHHHKHNRSNGPKKKKSNTKSTNSPPDDLEHIAEELIQAANHKLPDRVLPGILKGHEGDIRQHAVLLALSWYLRADDPDNPLGQAWHLPRAIAGTTRIAIRDHYKSLKRYQEALQKSAQIERTPSRHPSALEVQDWPYDVMRYLTKSAITIALSRRMISPLNAAIAMAILVEGMDVADLARRKHMHPSNIYQHLTRARRHIAEIIDTIELPLTKLQIP